MTYPKKQAEAQGIFQKTGGFVQGNMTLRDYFAAKAMQSMISRPDYEDAPANAISLNAYTLADAMLEERIK